MRAQAVRRDVDAFATVYERYHGAIYRYCRSMLRNDEDARDALQSTMAKALAALRHEERDFELRPWLFSIAHNEAVSRLRQRRDTIDLDAAGSLGSDSLPQTVEDRERITLLRADLRELPDRQRAALVLRELCGLGHKEIAAVLETTPRVVKQTIFEARAALHECAEGRDMICAEVQRALSDGDGRVLRGRRMRAHVRSCRPCRRFQAALDQRPRDLAALAPALPAGAGGGALAQLLASLESGGAIASIGGGAAATVAAKVAMVAAATVTAVGATTLVHETHHATRAAPAAPGAPARAIGLPAVVAHDVTGGRPAAAQRPPGHRAAPGARRPTVPKRAGAAPARKPASAEQSMPVVAAPPGDAKQQADAAPLPPGQAKQQAGAAPPPPGQAKKQAGAAPLPPGQAKKQADGIPLPPGQAKQQADGTPGTPPGQAKKDAAASEPPGQAKKQADAATLPPGQAKKQAATAPVAATEPAAAAPEDQAAAPAAEPPGQAKKDAGGSEPPGRANK